MIHYKIDRDLFQEEVTIKLVCEHLKDYTPTARIKEAQIKAFKHTQTKQALLMLASKMIGQRRENYKFGNMLREEHLFAMVEGERLIKYFGGSTLDHVLSIFQSKLIPCLEAITPAKDSRYYTNYAKKLTDLSNFINTSLLKIEALKQAENAFC